MSSPRQPTSIDGRLIGLTVEEAIQNIQLRLDEYFILDEPPGIARAVKGYAKNSEQVELYFKRGDVPVNMKRDWKLKDVLHLKVVAIAYKNSEGWHGYGNLSMMPVVSQLKINLNRKNERSSEQKRGADGV